MRSAQTFFGMLLALSLQFSACVGLAVFSPPVSAAANETAVPSETAPMSPLFPEGNVCERAVASWSIADTEQGGGCQDTTACLQGTAHSVRERAVALHYNMLITPAPSRTSDTVKEVYTGYTVDHVPRGPVPQHAVYRSYLTARRE